MNSQFYNPYYPARPLSPAKSEHSEMCRSCASVIRETEMKKFSRENGADNMLCVMSALPENYVPAMAYVPFQTDFNVYSADEALMNGTLFPVLNKPYTGCCK